MATVVAITRTVRIHASDVNNSVANNVFREVVTTLKPLCHASSPITIQILPGDPGLGVQATLQCDCDLISANDVTFVSALNSATHGLAGNQTWAQYLGTSGSILDSDSISSTLGH